MKIFRKDGSVAWEDQSVGSLSGADLSYADLRHSDLSDADLFGADLSYADLSYADLNGADLVCADLSNTTITHGQLRSANTTVIKANIFAKLAHARHEAPGLLDAVRKGWIDGSAYEGECSCFVGTLATIRGCAYDQLPGIAPDASSPTEMFFFAIQHGDTPDTNPVSAIVAEWIEEFMAEGGTK